MIGLVLIAIAAGVIAYPIASWYLKRQFCGEGLHSWKVISSEWMDDGTWRRVVRCQQCGQAAVETVTLDARRDEIRVESVEIDPAELQEGSR